MACIRVHQSAGCAVNTDHKAGQVQRAAIFGVDLTRYHLEQIRGLTRVAGKCSKQRLGGGLQERSGDALARHVSNQDQGAVAPGWNEVVEVASDLAGRLQLSRPSNMIE